MNITIDAVVAASLCTAAGALVGYYIKSFLSEKEKLNSEIAKERRDHYQKFVDLIIDLFSQGKAGVKKKKDIDINKELYAFYKSYILYASPSVIRKFADCFQVLYEVNKHSAIENEDYNLEILKGLTRILKAMRKDLGLSNKKLGKNGEELLRAMITDFSKITNK